MSPHINQVHMEMEFNTVLLPKQLTLQKQVIPCLPSLESFPA